MRRSHLARQQASRYTDDFSEEIFEQLKSSAILVSIVSPSGIRSQWCQDERQKFEQFAALNGGFRIKNVVRAVKVVKTPLDHDAHRELFNTLGFEFYEREAPSDRFQEFDDTSLEYRKRLTISLKTSNGHSLRFVSWEHPVPKNSMSMWPLPPRISMNSDKTLCGRL